MDTSKTYDLLVLGGGNAGLCAALVRPGAYFVELSLPDAHVTRRVIVGR